MSELSTVHNAAGAIRRALEALPEWSKAHTALDLLKGAKTEAIDTPRAADVATGLLLAAVTQGNPVPTDLLEQVTTAARRAEAATLVLEAHQQAEAQMRAQMDNAVQSNWSALFAALDSELAENVNQIRGLGDLENLIDARTAVRHNRVEDFSAFESLVAEHKQIRFQQDVLARRARQFDDADIPEAMFIRGVDASWSDFCEWRAHQGRLTAADGSKRHAQPPWPNEDGKLTTNIASQPAFIAWAVETDATLWIPGPAQLREETSRLRKATSRAADRDATSGRAVSIR